MTDREILDTIDDLMIEADAVEDIGAVMDAWRQIRTLVSAERDARESLDAEAADDRDARHAATMANRQRAGYRKIDAVGYGTR